MHAYLIMAVAGVQALLLAGCTAPKSEAAERADIIAAGMSAIVPKDVGDGTTMTSVRADGARVILTFEGIPSRELAAPDFDQQIVSTICNDQGFRDVLAKDVEIMIDMVARNGRKASVGVKQCR
jgi:hypothetical protein